MAGVIGRRPPLWFTIVAVLLVLWGLAGCFAFFLQYRYGVAMRPDGGEWERGYDAALPGWFLPVYAVAIFGGLAGSVALLLRRGLARWCYLVSLIAVLIQFGWVFGATDMAAVKGPAVAYPFPAFIVALAVLQLWLAHQGWRRGWLS
jgi:hypothetical protein